MSASNITEIIKSLGGEALFLAAAAWLIKTLVSTRLAREAEEFKITLQSRADVEIERMKASLQLVATEHQIRFAKLHEKRAVIIAELYDYLAETRSLARMFILGDVQNVEKAEQAKTKTLELYEFINSNRIYFPEGLCGLLDKFESRLRHQVNLVNSYWTKIKYPTPRTMEEQNRVMLEACNVLESELPAILKELEREFRLLLGETART